jgi:hypothetical protein
MIAFILSPESKTKKSCSRVNLWRLDENYYKARTVNLDILHCDNTCLCCFRCNHSFRHQHLGFDSLFSVGPCWLTQEIIYCCKSYTGKKALRSRMRMKATCSRCRKEIADDYPITVILTLRNFSLIEGEMVPIGVKGRIGEVSLLQRHITNVKSKSVIIE